MLSLNDDSAEQRYHLEPADNTTPETLFERSWALALLNDVLLRLETDYGREGKKEWMEAMRPALTADRNCIRYSDIAAKLGASETAARVAVHRLRQRYRRLLRAEVAKTVASPQQVEAEMRHLFEVLAGS
jgi:RNA polymerase sigma-70 factor (ECF subfamily)